MDTLKPTAREPETDDDEVRFAEPMKKLVKRRPVEKPGTE